MEIGVQGFVLMVLPFQVLLVISNSFLDGWMGVVSAGWEVSIRTS